MKKNYIFILPIIAALIIFSAFSGKDARYPNGSPAGYTGSPGDGKDCTQCHGGSASPVIGWITSNIPDEGYMPGETYDITATASGSGDKGFLISPQMTDGSVLGQLIAGSGSKLTGSGGYITHSSSSSSNPRVWNFQWTAPEAGTGTVTFYGAFTVNKPVTKLCTLVVNENVSIGMDEKQVLKFSLYPNPFRNQLYIDSYTSELLKVQLFDHMGRQVKSISANDCDFSDGINMEGLKSGVYILQVFTDEGFSAEKIIKH